MSTMNPTSHECLRCPGTLLVDDTDPMDLAFSCPECGATFSGYEDQSGEGFAYVITA